MSIVSHTDLLLRLKENGASLNTFYDIGASIGRWSCEAQKIFPNAHFHLFEPLAGRYDPVADSARYLELNNYTLHPVALSDETGLHKMKVLGERGVGSSLLILASDYRKETTFLDVETDTMDSFANKHHIQPPDFIKIDTQASEMKVLAGGKECLKHCQFIVLETWARRVYGPETPLFHEIARFLYELDFCLYELLSLDDGRDSDGTLRWFDAAFINKSFSSFPREML